MEKQGIIKLNFFDCHTNTATVTPFLLIDYYIGEYYRLYLPTRQKRAGSFKMESDQLQTPMFYLGFKASTFCPVASFPINRQTGGSEVFVCWKIWFKKHNKHVFKNARSIWIQ